LTRDLLEKDKAAAIAIAEKAIRPIAADASTWDRFIMTPVLARG
jgi:hypothetical protein